MRRLLISTALVLATAGTAPAAMPTLDELFPVAEDRIYAEIYNRLALSFLIASECEGRGMFFSKDDIHDIRTAANVFTADWPELVKDKVWITLFANYETTPGLPVAPQECKQHFNVLQKVLNISLGGLNPPLPSVKRPF